MTQYLYFLISLATFALLLLGASLLSKTPFFQFLGNRSGRFETLDGLRGFLAISVFYHHFIITWYWHDSGKWVRPPEDIFQNYGKIGVALFFMITGFLFTHKIIEGKDKTNWIRLYKSRIFRIVPLYLFALLLVCFVVFSNTELVVSNRQLAKEFFHWFIFQGGKINNFAETKLIIAGVDWTLKYEWYFYFSLPVLALILMYGSRLMQLFWLVALPIFFFFKPFNIPVLGMASQFIILFMFGGLACVIKLQLDAEKYTKWLLIVRGRSVAVSMVLLLVVMLIYPKTLSFEHDIMMFVFFLLVILGNSLFGLFTLTSAKLLGEISYSIYLLHGSVIYLCFSYFKFLDIKTITLTNYMLLMPLIGLLVVVFSSITYLSIEKPCITLGKGKR